MAMALTLLTENVVDWFQVLIGVQEEMKKEGRDEEDETESGLIYYY